MKRWMLLTLTTAIVLSGLIGVFYWRLHTNPSSPSAGLKRIANSAYKYNLCTEAYAYAYATADNPYKTDFTFPDPFRKTNDTITPHLKGYDPMTSTVTFTVSIMVGQVATFEENIAHVHELDGIFVELPDSNNHLQHSAIPQFIISGFGKGTLAILDFTCPSQWKWYTVT